jgi:hypothetical protein
MRETENTIHNILEMLESETGLDMNSEEEFLIVSLVKGRIRRKDFLHSDSQKGLSYSFHSAIS